MSRRAGQQGWLPSSTQLFAAVVVTTVLTIAVSLNTRPVHAFTDTANVASTQTNGQTELIVAVGQLAQCQTPYGVPLDVLTATAKALKKGASASTGLLSNATALVSVGCSLQWSADNWVAGPYSQQQQLHVSGVDTLDCLVRQSGKQVDQAPHVFLLRPAGHSSQGVTQPAQVEAIEYAQLQHQPDSSAQDLLESLLRTSLPEECLAALHSYNNSNIDVSSASVSAATELTQQGMGYSRQLLQTAGNSTNSTAANSTADASQQPPSDKPAPEAASNSTAVKDTAKAAEQKGSTENGGKTNSTQSDSPQVIASDRVPTEVANSTAAGNRTALDVTLTPDAARLACALQPETGPCRAAFPRWAFELATGACKEFVYGGCAGNANNFVSQAACEAACLAVMSPAPVQQPTVVPNGPVSTTLDEARVLVGSAPAPAKSRAGGHDRSWAEQLLRVLLAGLVGVLTVLLL